MDDLGQGIGQAAGAAVVDREDRVGGPQRPAPVDDLLRAALDLRVPALDGIEVEVGCVRPCGHRRGRAAAQANQHARPADLDEQSAGRHLRLVGVAGADVPDAAGEHDRLVIAADDAGHLLLVRAEVAGQVRPAELVVERRRADRPFDHDGERRRDPIRLRLRPFPRPLEPGDPEVRHGKPAQSRFRFRALPGRALVADLAAGAGRSAGERRDGRRVIVRFNLHQGMRQVLVEAVPTGHRVGKEAASDTPLHHRRVVGIGDDGVLRVPLVGRTDHPEERLGLRHAIDDPRRVEDLVAAVLGVRLREHRELDVGGIPPVAREVRDEIVDLIGRQRQAERGVGLLDGDAAPRKHVHLGQRLRRAVMEQPGRRFKGGQHRLGHPVMQQRNNRADVAVADDIERRAALDAADGRQAALPRDVCGLGRPWRNRAQPGCHQHRPARRLRGRRAVGQQASEDVTLTLGKVAGGLDEMPEPRGHDNTAGLDLPETRVELVEAKGRQRPATANSQDAHVLPILPVPAPQGFHSPRLAVSLDILVSHVTSPDRWSPAASRGRVSLFHSATVHGGIGQWPAWSERMKSPRLTAMTACVLAALVTVAPTAGADEPTKATQPTAASSSEPRRVLPLLQDKIPERIARMCRCRSASRSPTFG